MQRTGVVVHLEERVVGDGGGLEGGGRARVRVELCDQQRDQLLHALRARHAQALRLPRARLVQLPEADHSAELAVLNYERTRVHVRVHGRT